MLAAPLRLVALLGLISLAACHEPEQVAAPSAFDWGNEQPSGSLVRRLDARGVAVERMRVSCTALRHYAGPGERGSHLRNTAAGLELLTADGRPWCRGTLDRAAGRASLACDGFTKVELLRQPAEVAVTRDAQPWGRLVLTAGAPTALESGATRLSFSNEAGSWSAKRADGASDGSMAGWSRGKGAPLLWLPLPVAPGFGDDRWPAVRASGAWLASALLDDTMAPAPAAAPSAGSGKP
jgi:hypothetical protein